MIDVGASIGNKCVSTAQQVASLATDPDKRSEKMQATKASSSVGPVLVTYNR